MEPQMKSRSPLVVALVALLGTTAVLAVRAEAQQPNAPAADQRGQGCRAMGMGMEMGMPGPMRHMSAEDRAAFLDARIAAVKAGLKLTPDQDKLWPAVESAVRDGIAKMAELHRQPGEQGKPADPVARMRRLADMASARGDALHKIVDAAQPLYASLSDDQKRRLPLLMHGPNGGRFAAMHERMREHMRGGDRRGGRGGDPGRERFGDNGNFDAPPFADPNNQGR
jgi:hypothetical protein